MPRLSEHDNDPPHDRGKRGFAVPALVIAVIFTVVLLHLTGVIGAGAH